MRRIGSWYVIYNLDGTFRGYEGIRYDEDGNALPSQVYAQEHRDEAGRPVTQPDRDDTDTVRCPERIRFHERNATIHRCVGVAGHTTYHWWSREGEQAWDARRAVPHV